MKKFRFLEFKSYQSAIEFRQKLKAVSNKLEIHRNFDLKSQLLRAANSIILNIAEGSSRHSDKDFKRFLEISLGSLFEVVACLHICEREEIISKDEFEKYLADSNLLASQIGGFIKTLATKQRSHKAT